MPDNDKRLSLEIEAMYGEFRRLAAGQLSRERAAMLEARCGGDAALLAEVRAFLHAASDTADFLSSSGAGIFGTDAMGAAGDYAANLAGKHFDAYHLLRKIGRGGMSVVYLAEPADGAYQQNVAVKLMLSATATDAAKRVGRERQTLAALNHPNIARLIDGGASNDGIPYLEMDYVDGERIDDWCHARMYMRLGRDLANYQVTQMGEAYWA